MAKNEEKKDPTIVRAEWEDEMRLREVLALESIVASLRRLSERFAPEPERVLTRRALPGLTCPKGHGMQPTDDYCQTCARETDPFPPAA